MTAKDWAIVTGASGGLGAAFTRAPVRRGYPRLCWHLEQGLPISCATAACA